MIIAIWLKSSKNVNVFLMTVMFVFIGSWVYSSSFASETLALLSCFQFLMQTMIRLLCLFARHHFCCHRYSVDQAYWMKRKGDDVRLQTLSWIFEWETLDGVEWSHSLSLFIIVWDKPFIRHVLACKDHTLDNGLVIDGLSWESNFWCSQYQVVDE